MRALSLPLPPFSIISSNVVSFSDMFGGRFKSLLFLYRTLMVEIFHNFSLPVGMCHKRENEAESGCCSCLGGNDRV